MMIIIRRCRGFVNGKPMPHRAVYNRDGSLRYATDKGNIAARNGVWRWRCQSAIGHRLGVTGGGHSYRQCLSKANAHWWKYHAKEFIYK